MARFDRSLKQFWGKFILDDLDLVFVGQNYCQTWDLVYFKVVNEVLSSVAVSPKHLNRAVYCGHLLHHLLEQLG